jgi:hypothetical protein
VRRAVAPPIALGVALGVAHPQPKRVCKEITDATDTNYNSKLEGYHREINSGIEITKARRDKDVA